MSYEIEEQSLDEDIFSSKTKDADQHFDDNPIHYNLRTLSYSSLLSLHGCPRRFELTRLMPRDKIRDDDEHGHLSFGDVVGRGIQEYFISSNRNKAIFTMFINWRDAIDETKAEKSAKTFWHAIHALDKFISFKEMYLSNYEVAYFQGTPAAELGFKIDFGNGFTYRGFIDLLLIHKTKRTFRVLECKTTGSYNVDEAMYKNSGQALGYGLVVDRIAYDLNLSNEYTVLYPVYLTRSLEWKEFLFPKSDVSRANWLQSILISVGHIQQYSELQFFPMHGQSCFAYNKQCKFFGMCTMSNTTLGLENAKVEKDDDSKYQFLFTIQELIEAQYKKGEINEA